MQFAVDIDVSSVQRTADRIRTQAERVMVGKEAAIELLSIALFCGGHALLEDVPGIGKTTLAKTFARTLGCTFSRIQFTPDLLPSDITGVSIFDQRRNDFEFRPGPIAAQIVLADEINRAGPRTQSALLEAMEERQVTVDGVSRPLPYPFFVLATQNPVELEGTFPLPEAQLDRFLIRIALGYPQREEERAILRRFRTADPLASLEAAVEVDELRAVEQICRQVQVVDSVEDYLLDLVAQTRAEPGVALGASPRASMALYRTSQARAALRGRNYVLPDDIKALMRPVLGHRLLLSSDARLRNLDIATILDQVVTRTPVPVEERWPTTEVGQ